MIKLIDKDEARNWSKERIREEIEDLRREISDFNWSIQDNQERIDEEEKGLSAVQRRESGFIEQLTDQINTMYRGIDKAEDDIRFLKSLL